MTAIGHTLATLAVLVLICGGLILAAGFVMGCWWRQQVLSALRPKKGRKTWAQLNGDPDAGRS